MLLLKCVVCDCKKLKFIKEQELESLLSMTGTIQAIGLLLI